VLKSPCSILQPSTDLTMKSKLILLLFCSLSAWNLAMAQDEAIFGHYNITPVLINPSAVGFDNAYQLQLNTRAQWSGFADAPTTYAAQYNGPLGDNFGLGVGVLTESAAQLQRLRAHLNYAFRFDIGDNVKLAAGFQAEYQQLSLDNSVMSNNFVDFSDELVQDFMNGKGEFDAALGFFSSFGENTRLGLSFTNLVRSRISQSENESILEYYTFFASHRMEIEDLDFSFEPSILLRNVRNVPSQIDINLMARFLDDQLTTGLSYRSLGALGILLGTQLPMSKTGNIQIYYSYDVFFQEFQSYNNGSHEISLVLGFERKSKKRRRY